MKNIKEETFLNAIENLPSAKFIEVVNRIQEEYWHYSFVENINEKVSIQIYVGKSNIKKSVMVTCRGLVINDIKNSIETVARLINEQKSGNRLEVYCSRVKLDKEQMLELQDSARIDYDIDLIIYDQNTMVTKQFPQIMEYAKLDMSDSHYDLVDDTTKILYDLLSNGNDASDIKNSLYYSVILLQLYQYKQPIIIDELKKKVEEVLKHVTQSFPSDIRFLIRKKRIVCSPKNSNLISLSENERKTIEDNLSSLNILEQQFNHSFTEIANTYGIEDVQGLRQELIDLYSSSYSNSFEIEEDSNDDALEKKRKKVFKRFRDYIRKRIGNDTETDNLVRDIMELCDDNSYLNRITTSSSFLSLYNSNNLERYLSKKQRNVFMDTPVICYFLCAKIKNLPVKQDWDNSYYQSVRNLISMQEQPNNHIQFYLFDNYLDEVVGELQKAIRISWFEQFPDIAFLKETNNTFFNYYIFLKENPELTGRKLHTFKDFYSMLGIDTDDPDDSKFHEVVKNKIEYLLCNKYKARSFGKKNLDNLEFSAVKKIYEEMLSRDKSVMAIAADTKLVMHVMTRTDLPDINSTNDQQFYFTSWDKSFYKFQNALQKRNPNIYKQFIISTPPKLVNRISFENFKIDNTCITKEVFFYADSKFKVSKKIKILIDKITPVFGRKGNKNIELITEIQKLATEQLHSANANNDFEDGEKETTPFEDILLKLSDVIDANKFSITDFSNFISTKENNDFVIQTLRDSFYAMKECRQYDMTAIFERKLSEYTEEKNNPSKDESIILYK